MLKSAQKRASRSRALVVDDLAQEARALAGRVFGIDQAHDQIVAIERQIAELYLKADVLRRREWLRYTTMTLLPTADIRAKRNAAIQADYHREASRAGIVAILASRYGVSLATITTVVRPLRTGR